MNKSTKQMVQKIMNQPREQIVERMMRGFGQILTTDQYKKAEQAFLIMPDDVFKQMVEDSIRSWQQKAPTAAQHIITPAIKHCRRDHWNHQDHDREREPGEQSKTGRASGFVTVMS